MNLQPPSYVVYPPHKNGKYIEEYFADFWNKRSFHLKDNFIYIDIFWNNLFHINGNYKNVQVLYYLETHVAEKCEEAKRTGKIPFTICQWDDGIVIKKPENLIVFSMGQSKDIALPLIVEDVSYTLETKHRLSFDQKDILCSFVGSRTFNVEDRNTFPRDKMVNALVNKSDCFI